MSNVTQLRHRCVTVLPPFDDDRANQFLDRLASTDPTLLPLVADNATELLAALRERADSVVLPADFSVYGLPSEPFADPELILSIIRALYVHRELSQLFNRALSDMKFTSTRRSGAGR